MHPRGLSDEYQQESPQPQPAPASRPGRVRATVGGAIGQAIEFYDFTVYGFLAVYISAAFFPSDDPATELLSGFAVFGLAFLARPLGGFNFGPLAATSAGSWCSCCRCC